MLVLEYILNFALVAVLFSAGVSFHSWQFWAVIFISLGTTVTAGKRYYSKGGK